MALELEFEEIFENNIYGFRLGRSPTDVLNKFKIVAIILIYFY